MYENEMRLIIQMTRFPAPAFVLDFPAKLDWDFVNRTLIENRLAGLAYWRMTQKKIDFPGLKELEPHFRTNQYQNLLLLEESEKVLEALNQAGIEVLLTKGLLLLGKAYPLGTRRMGDIDLLIRPVQSQTCLKVFERLGYQIGHKDRSSELGAKNCFDFYLPRGQQFIMIDLSWEFLDHPGRRGKPEFYIEDLFARAKPIKLGAITAYGLNPIDQIIHTAAHVSMHHDLNYPTGLVDVAALVAGQENLDWEALESRAAFFQLRNAVICTLGVAHELYGLTVGESILQRWRNLRKKGHRSSAVLFFDPLWILGAERESFLGNQKSGLERNLALTFFKDLLMDSSTARWKSKWRKIRPDRARIWKAYRVFRPLWAVWILGFFHLIFYFLFLLMVVPLLQVLRPVLGVRAKRRLGWQRFL